MLVVDNVTYAYADAGEPALNGVSLTVAPGETVALIGANGSGKSTLAALLNGLRLPQEGRVVVDGVDTGDKDRTFEVRSAVGVVRQDPALQLVATIVADDVAFGPRNLGLDEDEVARRVDNALATVGLADYARAETNALSGGQQQRVALAGVLAMEPRYLVLDEATAMLDTAARRQLRGLVRALAEQGGVGVVSITHDPLEALAADKVVVLDRGKVAWDGAPRELAGAASSLLRGTLRMDAYAEVAVGALRAGYDARCGLEPEQVAAWYAAGQDVPAVASAGTAGDACAAEAPGEDAGVPAEADGGAAATGASLNGEVPRAGLRLHGVSFSYGTRCVLKGCSLSLGAGERMLVAGVSGAGKSTLALVLAGLEEPDAGSVSWDGRAHAPGAVGMVFQRPEDQLFLDTVRQDIGFGPRNLGLSEAEVARRVADACALVGLDDALLSRHPVTLSGGQARRAALAGIAAMEPRAYVLDEPTAGLDVAGRRFLHQLVDRLAAAGAPVVVMSHDLDEWVGQVDRVALLGAGRVAWQGPADDLLAHPERFEAVGLEAPEISRFRRALAARAGAGTSAGAPGKGGAASCG